MITVSSVDIVKKYLEDRIVRGVFRPGQKIKEEDVSRELRISRPPIREAFKLLEAAGAVVRKPNIGVFVSEIRERDIWELYTLKQPLYQVTVGLAFDRITGREVRELKKTLEKMAQVLDQDGERQVAKFQEADVRFHNVFINLANHGRLVKIIRELEIQIKRVMFESLLDREYRARTLREHESIYEAVARGDREAALARVGEHIWSSLMNTSRQGAPSGI